MSESDKRRLEILAAADEQVQKAKNILDERTYGVQSVFKTIQGEGHWSGHRAVFVRFLGCNVWSGSANARVRDSAKGVCAKFCDTDFVHPDPETGGHLGRSHLAALIAQKCIEHGVNFVVFTGGEPALQLDEYLMDAIRRHLPRAYLAIETNGSRPLPRGLSWVCVSPKPPMTVYSGNVSPHEVKVPYPDCLDLDWLRKQGFKPPPGQGHTLWYASPAWPLGALQDEVDERVNHTAKFVHENPGWLLTLQAHKYAGIP